MNIITYWVHIITMVIVPHCVPISTHFLTFRGQSVCLCVEYDREPCKTGRTDQNATWRQTRVGPRNHIECILADLASMMD